MAVNFFRSGLTKAVSLGFARGLLLISTLAKLWRPQPCRIGFQFLKFFPVFWGETRGLDPRFGGIVVDLFTQTSGYL